MNKKKKKNPAWVIVAAHFETCDWSTDKEEKASWCLRTERDRIRPRDICVWVEGMTSPLVLTNKNNNINSKQYDDPNDLYEDALKTLFRYMDESDAIYMYSSRALFLALCRSSRYKIWGRTEHNLILWRDKSYPLVETLALKIKRSLLPDDWTVMAAWNDLPKASISDCCRMLHTIIFPPSAKWKLTYLNKEKNNSKHTTRFQAKIGCT